MRIRGSPIHTRTVSKDLRSVRPQPVSITSSPVKWIPKWVVTCALQSETISIQLHSPQECLCSPPANHYFQFEDVDSFSNNAPTQSRLRATTSCCAPTLPNLLGTFLVPRWVFWSSWRRPSSLLQSSWPRIYSTGECRSVFFFWCHFREPAPLFCGELKRAVIAC